MLKLCIVIDNFKVGEEIVEYKLSGHKCSKCADDGDNCLSSVKYYPENLNKSSHQKILKTAKIFFT